MKMDFELANSADPDEMPQSWSSLFAKVPVKGFLVFKGLIATLSSVTFFFLQNVTFICLSSFC